MRDDEVLSGQTVDVVPRLVELQDLTHVVPDRDAAGLGLRRSGEGIDHCGAVALDARGHHARQVLEQLPQLGEQGRQLLRRHQGGAGPLQLDDRRGQGRVELEARKPDLLHVPTLGTRSGYLSPTAVDA